MISTEHKQQWRALHWEWIAANKVADFLDQQLSTTLKLLLEGQSGLPTEQALEEWSQARSAATAARNKLDLFVDKLFLGVGYK